MAAHADKRIIRNVHIMLLFSYFLVGCTSDAEYAAYESAQWAFTNGMTPGFCGYVHGMRDSQNTTNQELYPVYLKEVRRRGWNCDVYKNFPAYRQRYEYALNSEAKPQQTEPQAAPQADGFGEPPSAPAL